MPAPIPSSRFSVAALVVFLAGSTAAAQPDVIQPTSSTREALGEDLSSPEPGLANAQGEPAPRLAATLLPRIDITTLPGEGGSGFGVQDLEVSLKYTVPLGERLGPIWITPGVALRNWQGPESSSGPGFGADLPGSVYDLYVDFGWRPRPQEWLFLDLQFTPGIYTDGSNDTSATFRPRGRALAIFAFSEQFQVVAGALYTNRLRTTLIPAGGILWKPNEDTQIDLVFPAPKIARRLGASETRTWWAYVAGEFGGGAWGIERAAGFDDTVDYTDLRVIVGIEGVGDSGVKEHLEIGYVFARRISYDSERPGSFDPSPTIMLRAGISY